MKIVVIGMGKVGRTLVGELSREGHDITAVDSNEASLEMTVNQLDVLPVAGNGATRGVLVEAGAQSADLVIAATGQDEVNLLCCLVARKLGAKRTIARVRNPEYADELPLIQEELGLSMAVNPDHAAAVEIFSLLRMPSALKVEKFSKGRVELVELQVAAGGPLDGVALHQINQKYQVKVLICAVCRGEDVTIPRGNFVLQAGDRFIFTAAPKNTLQFLKALRTPMRRLKNVMIVGGGRISFYLTRMLNSIGVHPCIIELDPARARVLSEMFPDCLIINGDGADQDLLLEEGIATADAFVSLSGLDEENMLLSMFAQKQGVEKIVTKVSKTSLLGLLDVEKRGSVVSPKETTANQILSYVRALQNSTGSKVETLYRIVDGGAEALEFRVGQASEMTGIPLKDLKLQPEVLISAIIRGNQVIVPDGGVSIQPRDRVIVVTKNLRPDDLEDILA